MKKVLFAATVDSHILNFHIPYLKYFKDSGYEVHVATNSDKEIPYCDVKHKVSFERKPFKVNNIRAIGQLKKIIDKENFDIIHCHTPMGGAVTRIAAKKARKRGTKVFYTAHGFHFFKGAPLLNWLLFYPVEKHLSKYTDALITINEEDYNIANKKFHAKKTYLVHGVGVDPTKFNIEMSEDEKNELRKSLGLNKEDFVLIYVAELNKNKNQSMIINVMKILIKDRKNIKLLLVGIDSFNGYYQKMVKKYDLEDNIKFLGYRKDVPRLLKIAGLGISCSMREGLPVNIMEEELSSLPIICTNCRGNRDLIKNNVNGFLVDIDDIYQMAEDIKVIMKNRDIRQTFMQKGKEKIKKYELDNVMKEMDKIYKDGVKKVVLHVLNSNSYSGAENVAITIINNIKEKYDNEFECIYVSPNGTISETLSENGITYVPIKKLNRNQLKKVVNKYKPDIIHAHDFRASVLCSIYACNERKVISHIHNNASWIRNIGLYSLLYLISSIKYTKILVVSKSIINEYIFSRFIKNKFIILGNPINFTNVLNLSKFNTPDNKKYDVIFLGRLSYEKNPDEFIDIVYDIVKKNKNFHAAIVGNGKLYDFCKEKINSYKITNNVDLLGFVKNPYVILKNSKCLCITSKWEGFGIVAIEAAILKVYVVSSPVGGLVDTIKKIDGKLCYNIKDYERNIICKHEIVKDNDIINNLAINNKKIQNIILSLYRINNIKDD